MPSATVARPPNVVADERVVLACVSWDTYERLLADDEERRILRMTYDQGVLELVTPSKPPEVDAATITRFVDIVTAVLGIPIQSTASTAFRRQDLERGFEPDSSFYIQNEERVGDKTHIDPATDPPPDLIIEIEVTRSAIPKLPIYARMGVPEIWRFDGERVTIHQLAGSEYDDVPASTVLPPLSSDILTRFMRDSRLQRRTVWIRQLREWAQAAKSSS
jgi:Uma2 family endonuclease